MERKNVESSNIMSIGYDSKKKILEVEFNNGTVYQYLSVPKERHTGIMRAASAGMYLNKHIRDRYKHVQVV